MHIHILMEEITKLSEKVKQF